MPSIDLYADIACPWCWIGERRLRAALDARPEVGVEVRWRPFQLQPGLPPGGEPWAEFVERKFGGMQRAAGMFAQVAAAGAPEGIPFRFDRVVVAPNTRDAHRVMLLATERGKVWEAAEALFSAYFAEGRDVTDADVLVEVAASAGLDEAEARAMLASGRYAAEVDASQEEAERTGVTGVPFVVVDGRWAISGAQPPAVFARAVEMLASGAEP